MSRLLVLLIAVCVSLTFAAPGSVFEGWRFDPNTGYSSQQVLYSNGNAFVATTYNIYAVNTSNGWQKWNFTLYPNSLQTMQIKGDLLIWQTTAYLGAARLADGSQVWNISSNSTSSWSSSSAPLFASDTWMYAFATSGSDFNMFKVNIQTGVHSLWATETGSGSYQWPQLVNGNLLLINNNYLLLMNMTGTRAWRTYMSYSPSLEVMPVVWNGIALYPSYSMMYAYNLTDGTKLWSTSTSGTGSGNYQTLALSWNSTKAANLLAVRGQYVFFLDPVTGNMGTVISNPQSNTFYSSAWDASTNHLYVGDYWGYVANIDVTGQTLVWQIRLDSSTTPYLMVRNGTVYASQYSYAYGINGTTGGVLTKYTSEYSITMVLWDMDDFGGALLVLQSYGRLTILMVNVGGAASSSFTFANTPDTPLTPWGGAAYWAANSIVSAVAANGTSLWNTTVTDTNFYVWRNIAPVFANNNVYFAARPNSGSNDYVMVFNAYTGTYIKSVAIGTPTKGNCGTFSSLYIQGMLVDGTDIFITASDYGVFKIDNTNTVTCGKTEYSTTTAPTTSTLLVYVSSGTVMYAFAKFDMKNVWATKIDTVDIGSRNIPTFIDGDLYPGDNYGNLYCYGSSLGNKLWKAPIGGSTVQNTFGFYGYVYATNSNGQTFSFEEGYLLLAANHYKQRWMQNTPSNYDLGMPVISPDGIMVFTNSYGVYAMYYNGTSIWNMTGYSCTAGRTSIYMGVVYALCSGRVRLLDLYRGREWLRTQTGIDYMVAINNTVLAFQDYTLSTISTGTTMLYAASQLPPPLPASRSLTPEELLEKNKLWIAGVVAAIVVIVIVVLVAKKLSGGKKDTDYVAMQNPVNTGGV